MDTQVAEILIDIEAQLRALSLWERVPPPASALASPEPFCIDTLSLPQWLQFVFLPTLYQLLEEEGELPTRCSISPMAEEYFRGSRMATDELLAALQRIDETLTAT